jgi:four helix bundle protein
MHLAECCYARAANFPRFEQYGLANQLRRAAVSIPANLAEGYCRRTTPAYANHLSIALGSHAELETLIELAGRLKYVTDENARELTAECATVGRLLSRLHQALERKLATG